MTRLRIAHIAPSLNVGGLEKMLADLARRHDDERFELKFISIAGKGDVGAEIEALGGEVTALDSGDGIRPGVIVDLAKLFRANAIDIVHTHNNRALLYGALAAKLARTKGLVHTRHGIEPVSGRLASALPWIMRLTDRIVCVSRDNASEAQASGAPREKVVTILNGVDLDRFPYSGATLNGPIVAVARLSPEKDLGNLIEAVALAVKSNPDIHLQIAGDGQCRQDLEDLRARLGMERHVEFLGQVYDVPSLLKRARAFVLSSLTEGISLTLLEAMARGLPVIATAVGGNVEVVSSSSVGHLVPARDPAALSDAILAVFADPGAAAQVGRNARAVVEQRFDLRRTVRDYERLYDQIHSAKTGIARRIDATA